MPTYHLCRQVRGGAKAARNPMEFYARTDVLIIPMGKSGRSRGTPMSAATKAQFAFGSGTLASITELFCSIKLALSCCCQTSHPKYGIIRAVDLEGSVNACKCITKVLHSKRRGAQPP